MRSENYTEIKSFFCYKFLGVYVNQRAKVAGMINIWLTYWIFYIPTVWKDFTKCFNLFLIKVNEIFDTLRTEEDFDEQFW